MRLATVWIPKGLETVSGRWPYTSTHLCRKQDLRMTVLFSSIFV